MSSVSRSHSHIATKRRQNVNLQPRRVDGVKELVCAACIKATKKVKKIKTTKPAVAKATK
jgi:ribosomal protein L28